MFWAACCLAFFSFLRCLEFTVPVSGFHPDVHLSVSDVQVDKILVLDNPMISIKCSKVNQFGVSSVITLARSDSELCPVLALLAYLHLRGPSWRPLFRFQDGFYLTRHKFASVVSQVTNAAGWKVILQLTASASEQLHQQPPWEFLIT